MTARGHLKLILSEPLERSVEGVASGDRVSVVQPIGSARRRWRWLTAEPRVAALWTLALALSLLALGVLLRR